jgi:hypothetical protein
MIAGNNAGVGFYGDKLKTTIDGHSHTSQESHSRLQYTSKLRLLQTTLKVPVHKPISLGHSAVLTSHSWNLYIIRKVEFTAKEEGEGKTILTMLDSVDEKM